MMNELTRRIIEARGPRDTLDPWRPWACFCEPEFSRHHRVEDVAVVFLTNRECPFHCLMCDLWKKTLTQTVPPGAIPAQIDYALSVLPPARHLKLYNSGNFFDSAAIPGTDWPEIARRISGFSTVIVENHPKLVSDACSEFQQLCGTQLEIALGLETSHEPSLVKLNKQMSVADFEHACAKLLRDGILVRAFILFKPPETNETDAIDRTISSLRFAFDCGVSCCSVIPVRTGNGIMEQLELSGLYQPPKLSSLETVMRTALPWRRGRIFVDLWEARRFADDPAYADDQLNRLQQMNLTQQVSVEGTTD